MCEYGNLGLTQTLKQLRDSDIRFPQVQQPFGAGAVFRGLGKLQNYADWTAESAPARAGQDDAR